ncbi:MAG: histidine--tRNA ligase [Patescibacteria group bacterium]
MSRVFYQSPRGTKDILPSEEIYWQYFFNVAQKTLSGAGFTKIETPHFENAEIYSRGIGETTDIVQKEMFLLQPTSSDEQVTYALRPEGTAGVVRAYIQNGMNSWSQPVRLWYFGAMFRRERPQRGRYREFYQLGAEIFGDESAKSDYLVVMSAWEILRRLGLSNLIVYASSIGCPDCRPKFYAKLKKFYKEKINRLCQDCLVRLEKNPLRLLDCKNERCQEIAKEAPNILDSLCPECRIHFQNTLEYLDYFGVRYEIESRLVRGLDYYTRTVFEIATINDKGRQSALGAGGRYDGLVQLLGGPVTPAVGYSLGVERIIEVMREQKVKIPLPRGVEVTIVQLGDKAKEVSRDIHDRLVKENINVFYIPSNDGLRQQLQAAAKLDSRFALIVGQREAMKAEVILRDLSTSTQETFAIKVLVDEIKKRLK